MVFLSKDGEKVMVYTVGGSQSKRRYTGVVSGERGTLID